jgi:hypothetical protein
VRPDSVPSGFEFVESENRKNFYGAFCDRRQARDLEDMRGLVGELRNEPTKLSARGHAALATLASPPQIDVGRLSDIGFCRWIPQQYVCRATSRS